MTTDIEPLTGELVPVDPPPAAPMTLFGNDPRLALERMVQLARVLVDVVRDRRLSVRISGREHLTAEAWTTLGAMLGVVPVVEWTRPLEDGTGWEARVEARTLDGRVIGAAESMCSHSERTWRDRDEYALRSMAQTRAIGRALRAPLGQIVVLAGYEPAGAEEMTANTAADVTRDGRAPIRPDVRPTDAQIGRIRELLAELQTADAGTDWPARARHHVGVPADQLTTTLAIRLIEALEVELESAIKPE